MKKFYSILIALLALVGVAQAQTVTFDFSTDDAYNLFGLPGFSSGTGATAVKDGDFTKDGSATLNGIVVTVSPSGKSNPNRMWKGSLRLYGGTLTVDADDRSIVAIKFNLNQSKWGEGNTADSGTLETASWTGDASSVVFTIAANTQITSMEVTLKNDDPNYVAAPKITPATGTYTSAKTVTITAGEGCTIYYTTDGGDPKASDAIYAGPFTVEKTTTVKAVAVKGDNMSEVASSIITISILPSGDGDGSLENPYNYVAATAIASALASGAKSDDVYVKGKVSKITYAFDAQHGTATFFITDDGNEADNQFQVYSTYFLGNRSWKDGDTQIKVGDDVIIYGKLTNFQGTPETAAKESCLYSLNGEKAPDIVYTEYNTLAAVKAAAPADEASATYAQLNVDNLLVSYVNGKSVYLFDGEDGMLIYGTNSKNLKTGDKISGNIKGKLYKRNGNTQLASTAYEVEVVSSGNDVVPQEVSPAVFNATGKTYENELITLKGLVPNAVALESKNITFKYEDEDEEVSYYFTVYDNFNVASTMVFDKNKAYTLTGLVAVYTKEGVTTIQIYPRTAADIDNGEPPVVYEFVGDGTLENPYTVEDIRHKEATETKTALEKDVWVKAYIVGYINGSSLSDKTAVFSAEPTEGVKDDQPVTYPVAASNVLVADAADVKDIANVIAIALQTGNPRTDLNLADNPTMLGTQVWLKGGIYKYMGVPGLKDVKVYSLDGQTIVDAINGITLDASAAKTIYNVAGQRVQNLSKAGLYIVNGKKVVVK